MSTSLWTYFGIDRCSCVLMLMVCFTGTHHPLRSWVEKPTAWRPAAVVPKNLGWTYSLTGVREWLGILPIQDQHLLVFIDYIIIDWSKLGTSGNLRLDLPQTHRNRKGLQRHFVTSEKLGSGPRIHGVTGETQPMHARTPDGQRVVFKTWEQLKGTKALVSNSFLLLVVRHLLLLAMHLLLLAMHLNLPLL